MAKFLTEEWVAQARAIHDELKPRATAPAAKARINLSINDVPADVSDADVAAKLDTTDGALELDLGNFDAADATISLDYDTAKALIVDANPQAVMQALLSGKVKITGDMSKVLSLQPTGQDELAAELAGRLQQITD